MDPLAVQLLGPPQGGPRLGTVGICWHTTEPQDPLKQSLVDAIATARWQSDPAKNTQQGSYNWIVARDGVVLTVPPNSVAWGVNPSSSAWSPAAFLSEHLSPRALKRPNHYLLNIAVQGRTDWFNQNGYPPETVTNCALLTRWLEATYAMDAFFCGHMNWQSNRFDPGPKLIPAVLIRYSQVTTPPTQVQVLQAKLTETGSLIVSLQLQAERNQNLITSLTHARDSLQAQVEALQLDKQWLESDLAKSQNEKTVLESRVSLLDAQLLDTMKRLTETQQQLDEANQTVSIVREYVDARNALRERLAIRGEEL